MAAAQNGADNARKRRRFSRPGDGVRPSFSGSTPAPQAPRPVASPAPVQASIPGSFRPAVTRFLAFCADVVVAAGHVFTTKKQAEEKGGIPTFQAALSSFNGLMQPSARGVAAAEKFEAFIDSKLAVRTDDFATKVVDVVEDARNTGVSRRNAALIATVVSFYMQDHKASKQSAPAPAPQAPVGIDVTRIADMFARVRAAGAKDPRVRIRAGEMKAVFYVEAHGKYAGQVKVADHPGKRNTLYGFLRGNMFHPTRDCTDALRDAIVRLAADPAAEAHAYGQGTSHCCFCGLELTDSVSIDLGYGPICEEKWLGVSTPRSGKGVKVEVSDDSATEQLLPLTTALADKSEEVH